jgi:hypothetical protein
MIHETVELRVHGVGGPSPQDVLGTFAPRRLDGDERAAFYGLDRPGEYGPSHSVEAYVWGGLTSSSRLHAGWWLLLPFSLLNVAGWMLLSGRGGHRPSTTPTEAEGGSTEPPVDEVPWHSSLWWLRALITVGGLLLTAAYTAWLAVITVDLLGVTCATSDRCGGRLDWIEPLDWFADGAVRNPSWVIGLAAFTLLALVATIVVSALRSHRRYEGFEPDPIRRRYFSPLQRRTLRRNENLKHPGFWYRWREQRRLLVAHTLVAAFVISTVTGHAFEAAGAGLTHGPTLMLGLAAIGALLLMLKPEPVVERPGEDPSPSLRIGLWAALSLLALAVLASGWGLGVWQSDRLLEASGGSALGFLQATVTLTGLELAIVAVAAPFLVVHFWGGNPWRSFFFDDFPLVKDGFRLLPPAVTGILAFGIANAGFGAVTLRLADWLDGDDGALTAFDSYGASGVGVDVFVVGVFAGLIGFSIGLLFRLFPSRRVLDGIIADYPEITDADRGTRLTRWLKKVARARVVSLFGRNADRMLTFTAAGLILAAAVVAYRMLGGAGAVGSPLFGERFEPIRHLASWTILLFIFPGVWIIRAASRSHGLRRQVGKVWDAITFWPRRFHPLGAPCYAERAVPDLRERIRMHVAAGRKVILRTHSQGTVLAFAALSQLLGEDQEGWRTSTLEVRRPGEGGLTWAEAQELEVARHGEESVPMQPGGHTFLGTEVALITMGSPLSQLHAPFFPAYFDNEGDAEQRRNAYIEMRRALYSWCNYYRATDYIGKAIAAGVDPDLDPAQLQKLLGLDWELRDPSTLFGDLSTHSGYPDEEAVRNRIRSLVTAWGDSAHACMPPGELGVGLREEIGQ